MERFALIGKHYLDYSGIYILSCVTAIAVNHRLFFVLSYRYDFHGNLLEHLFGNYLLTLLTVASVETP